MKPPTHGILCIMDASLNHIGEGLRVLEEHARFSLDDATLTHKLKSLRQKLVRVDARVQPQLIRGDNAAVTSAVMSADDVEKATRQLVQIIGGGV
jgi:hypothetical protein